MATVNEYLEQKSKVSANTLVVQPWLENFAKQYNKLHPGHIGSCLYTDVTILAGPHDNYFWNTKAGNLLRERYQRGEISIFCVKSDNAAFIIEYRLGGQKLFHHGDSLVRAPHKTAIASYFLYDGKEYPVPLDVAQAAKSLCSAQEYSNVLAYNLGQQRRYVR